MHRTNEFRSYARECGEVAEICRDDEAKTYWNELSEWWLRCAEKFDRQVRAESTRSSEKRVG
jgi:hypothetical protein